MIDVLQQYCASRANGADEGPVISAHINMLIHLRPTDPIVVVLVAVGIEGPRREVDWVASGVSLNVVKPGHNPQRHIIDSPGWYGTVQDRHCEVGAEVAVARVIRGGITRHAHIETSQDTRNTTVRAQPVADYKSLEPKFALEEVV